MGTSFGLNFRTGRWEKLFQICFILSFFVARTASAIKLEAVTEEAGTQSNGGSRIVESIQGFFSTGAHFDLTVTQGQQGSPRLATLEFNDGSQKIFLLQNQQVFLIPGLLFDTNHYIAKPDQQFAMFWGERGPSVLTSNGLFRRDLFNSRVISPKSTHEIDLASVKAKLFRPRDSDTGVEKEILALTFRSSQVRSIAETYLIDLTGDEVVFVASKYSPQLESTSFENLRKLAQETNSLKEMSSETWSKTQSTESNDSPVSAENPESVGSEPVHFEVSQTREGVFVHIRGANIVTKVPFQTERVNGTTTLDGRVIYEIHFQSLEMDGRRYLILSTPYSVSKDQSAAIPGVDPGETYIVRDDGVRCFVGYFFKKFGPGTILTTERNGILSFLGFPREIDLREFQAEAQRKIYPNMPVLDQEGKQVNFVSLIFGQKFRDLAQEVRNNPQAYTGADHSLSPEDEEMIHQIASAVLGKETKSAIILGESGSGKTRVMKEFAKRVVLGQVRGIPRTTRFPMITRSAAGAGSKYTGAIESITAAISEVARMMWCLPFADEIHTLQDMGTHSNASTGMLEAWKSDLADGVLGILGTSTESEFYRTFGGDSALLRRLAVMTRESLSTLEQIKIALKAKNLEWEGMAQSDDLLKKIVLYSDHFDVTGAQPSRAIRLLDRMYGLLNHSGESHPVFRESDLKRAAALLYHLSNEQIDFALAGTNFKQLAQKLGTSVVAMEDAKEALLELSAASAAGITNPNRPEISLLLAGPPGLGKTTLVEGFARAQSRRFKRFQMNEWSDNKVQEFRNAIALELLKDSRTVFLFDEIEGAPREIQEAIFGIADTGKFVLTRKITPQGEATVETTIIGKHAMLFATTNAGTQWILGQRTNSSRIGFGRSDQHPSANRNALEKLKIEYEFRDVLTQEGISKKLLERFAVVAIEPPTPDQFKLIVRHIMRRIVRTMEESRTRASMPMAIQFEDEEGIVREVAQQFYQPGNGAHLVDRFLERSIRAAVTSVAISHVGQNPEEALHIVISRDSHGDFQARVKPVNCEASLQDETPHGGER